MNICTYIGEMKMNTLKTAFIVLALAIIVLALPTSGSAADLNGKTVIAFTQPVQVPGMVLQPGAYVFKTSSLNKHVVQVYDGSEKHLLTTLMTVSSYRLDTSSKVATFEERQAGL